MKIRKSSISIFLCIVLLLSLVPASAASAAETIHPSPAKTVEVTVNAIDKETGEDVRIEGALVTITNGGSVIASATTDTYGVARISLEGISKDELRNATVQACKTVAQSKGISASGRDTLFKNFANGSDDYVRYEYELHSETIDADGNWIGKDLPISTDSQADIVFVIDGTGSMEDDLVHIKEEIMYFLQYMKDIAGDSIDARYSVIEYRDFMYGEKPFLHERDGSHWFTNTADVLEIINGIEADGGGDTPCESLTDTIHWPLVSDEMDYRNDAFHFAFLITDAKTNADIQGGAFYLEPWIDLAEKNIITSVAAEEEFEDHYRYLYEKTGGEFMGITWPGICWNMFDVVVDNVLAETIKMELTLSEPRMHYNLSMCYLADDELSRSDEYREAIIDVLTRYSLLLAETTDGHVYLNKVILFSTDSMMNFYDTSNIAAMADIRMVTTKNDSASIHSNASVNGFYSGETRTANIDFFHDLDEETTEDLKGTQEFRRIQIGGKSYETGKSFFDRPGLMALTLTHESGHYILGFFDEYYDQYESNWNKKADNDKPYYEYGLMDNEYNDIEMSKEYIAYVNSGPSSTYHHYWYGESCEDVLADILEKGKTDKDSNKTFLEIDQLFESPYRATYTKANKTGADRTVSYPDAALSNDSFIFLNDPATGTESTLSAEGSSESEIDFSAGSIDDSLSLYLKKTGDSDYTRVDLTENEDGSVNAELPVEEGEMAEVLIPTIIDDEVSFETYYVSVTEPTTGYMYSSPDNKIFSYATTAEEASYTFIAQNTSYENGEFTSLNQALELSADGAQITGGEIYSVASCTADLDFTSISWFKFDGNSWTAIPTDCVMEENYNIGARADLDGEGLYVLMGRKAAEGTAESPDFLISDPSKIRDAVVEISFDDFNDNTKFYYVYYTDITDEEGEYDEESYLEEAIMNVYPEELCNHISETERAFTLTLPERGHFYRVSVAAVLDDGSRSALSTVEVSADEADRDGDGIPDWYMNQYRLWPKDGTDISGNDPDGDGLTNLEEFLGGTDPIVPEAVKSGNALR